MGNIHHIPFRAKAWKMSEDYHLVAVEFLGDNRPFIETFMALESGDGFVVESNEDPFKESKIDDSWNLFDERGWL